MKSSKYVQYGCGWSAPDGWLNFDASPTILFERLPILGKLYTKNKERFPSNVYYGNIVKGLPIPEASCTAVYCSHVLEHLSLKDFRSALRNTYRILEQGGLFRLVVPDLSVSANNYVQSTSPDAALTFMKETGLGKRQSCSSFKDCIVDFFGNSQHLWMWDYPSLQAELKDAGFEKIRQAQFGDSPEKIFTLVESEQRWMDAVGIDCIKPRL